MEIQPQHFRVMNMQENRIENLCGKSSIALKKKIDASKVKSLNKEKERNKPSQYLLAKW